MGGRRRRDGFEERFGEGDVFVGCTRRGVDEEIVERGPEDGGQELAHHGCFLGTAPYDCRGAGGEEEGE